MASLTDADKKAFITKIIAGLRGNAAALTAAGFDPATRIANLENGQTTVLNDETLVSQLEVALKTATDTRRTDLENNYKLASSTVSLVEGALGKEHPFVEDLHQIRGSFSNDTPEPPKPV
jgi:hypothetical protein